MTFLENFKMILSNSYLIPENATNSKNNHRKINLIKIIEESFDMRQGPALIFFEVIYLYISYIYNLQFYFIRVESQMDQGF